MSSGPRAATVSLVAAAAGVGGLLLVGRLEIPVTSPPGEWAWVAVVTAIGIVALRAALVAEIRGGLRPRIASVVGALGGLWLILVGTAPLWFHLNLNI